MEFDYHKEISTTYYIPTYDFFRITVDEIRSVVHKFGISNIENYEEIFKYGDNNLPGKRALVLKLLQECNMDYNVDLGINYKEKYEELTELLEPHKIDEMPPSTTLKMILKQYEKNRGN